MMNKATFGNLTKFAQNIVDSKPKDQLEDYWIEFDTGNEILDINIWWDEDVPIRAVAFPTRELPDGYRTTVCGGVEWQLPVRETIIDQVFCDIPVKEK